MTIKELIERLEQYRDLLGGDAEVRLMTQENWPFENTIYGLASAEEINDAGNEHVGIISSGGPPSASTRGFVFCQPAPR